MRITLIAVLSLFGAVARADEVKVITQELQQESVLTLRNDVSQDLAENLISAQAAASYGGPASLQESINSVLKAISIEQSSGIKYCDDSNCAIVWAQSEIADNPNGGLGFNAVRFDEQPVGTPEPSVLVLVLVGLGLIKIVKNNA